MRPSKLLNVKGEVAALDFDTACTLRLLKFDNMQAGSRNNHLLNGIGTLLGGGDSGSGGDVRQYDNYVPDTGNG